ncbi:hypothetical protein CISIN_1g048457mg, partial [Citrus sinensis]
YRLNESGNINVPPGATDLFCNGLCFKETHVMLDCVEKLLSNFNFYNKATVKDIRKALNSGCSYTSQRRMATGVGDGEAYLTPHLIPQ